MSSLTQWILIGSIFLALIIMIVSWLVTRSKIKSIQDKNLNQNNLKNISLRKNVGELLWEEKKKEKDPLDDFQMQMILSTIERNNFKKVSLSFKNNYVEKTLKKLGKQKIVNENFDWCLIETNKELNKVFDTLYKKSSKNTMIIIINSKNNKKQTKKLKNYLKFTNIRNDYEKIGKGMFFVVK